MTVDYRDWMKVRGVVPNSTWMKSDNTEMWIVLPDDDEGVRELVKEFACGSIFDNDPSVKSTDNPGWMRVARIRIEGRTYAGVDVVFIPMFLGQIDNGIFARIG